MKHLVIALHDVAPATLDETAHWRSVVAGLTDGPVSLLLIPRYRGRDLWRSGPAPRWVRERAGEGDEPVLHGWSHTRSDGRDGRELAGRDAASVRSIIDDGVEEMRSAGVVVRGFIAPSYEHPAAADVACRATGIEWWATRAHLRSREATVRLPSLGLGTSTAPRRVLSPAAARAMARALAAAPALRLDLHPSDLRHPRLATAGRELLARLLAQGRSPLTHGAILRRLRDPDPRAPTDALVGGRRPSVHP